MGIVFNNWHKNRLWGWTPNGTGFLEIDLDENDVGRVSGGKKRGNNTEDLKDEKGADRQSCKRTADGIWPEGTLWCSTV